MAAILPLRGRKTAEGILAFPLGWQATARRPPASPAGNPFPRGSRLRMEPAEWEVPMPLALALQGPPGAPRHPIPSSCSWRANRQEQDGGMGCRNPIGKLRRHGGFLRAAENRRETAGFPFLTAAKPPRSECP
ncbi:hypothetical protein NDU88_001585 [Pleurodeles waltl]|uniref:Uncharacterized protein n=1 Tax=Pleurodeles waltl TaxID=8319 RepID=A0AAV7WMK2_PLEWA|nr:hypothetical protein NDU88_001585 [Pleurodeles waltl]